MKKILLPFLILLLNPTCSNAQGFLDKLGKTIKKAGEIVDNLPSSSAPKTSSSSAKNSTVSSRTYTTKQGGMTISVVHSNLKIKIKRCEAAGNTVVIDFMVENVGNDDSELGIGGGSYNSAAYDDEGNVISNDNFKVQLGNSELSKWHTVQALPAGVPIKGRVQIEGVPESSTVFSRIDLKMSSDAWNFRDKVTTIKNVPISREGDE